MIFCLGGLAAILLWCSVEVIALSHISDPSKGAMTLFPPRVGWFNATLDHFRFDDERQFLQKCLVYDKFWHQPSGPILLYLGNEGQVEDFYNNTGFMFEMAPELGALVLFVEHRYYGSSLPFGNESLSPSNVVFLTVEQAMADFAVFLDHFRQQSGCPSTGCDTVLFGGSYGGMLAAWFRIKYPHLSVGALASSAPVDFYPNSGRQQAFWNATLHTYRKYGGIPDCDKRIEKAYAAMVSRVDSGDLAGLSSLLRTCTPLRESKSARGKLAQYVRGALSSMAMVDYPIAADFVTPMPANPVAVACAQAVPPGDDGLIVWLNSAINIYLNYTGQLPCHYVESELIGHRSVGLKGLLGGRRDGDNSIEMIAWNYQACTELILEPLTSDGFGFYPPDEDQIAAVEAACRARFNSVPRPAWIQTSTGGSMLRFASNIIFSNGEKDPWRTGAPQGNQLGPDVVLMEIPDAAHHEDLRFTVREDPPSVGVAKRKELAYIKRWLGLDARTTGHVDDAGDIVI